MGRFFFLIKKKKDTTPPTIVCSEDIREESVSHSGTLIDYSGPSISDDAATDVTVTCVPDAGTWFSVGDTEVTCRATDNYENESMCQFVVTIEGFFFFGKNLRGARGEMGAMGEGFLFFNFFFFTFFKNRHTQQTTTTHSDTTRK